MRLNYGCGKRVWPDYFNIDAVRHPDSKREPELLHEFTFDADGNLTSPIPLEDGCASELMAIHVFEHFHRWNCDAVIKEWARLLKPGGLLILELPDLYKCCLNIVENRIGKHPDQLGRWGIYGDDRDKSLYMSHPWGWFKEELIEFIKSHGFSSAVERPTVFHNSGKKYRDMRIEATKGNA